MSDEVTKTLGEGKIKSTQYIPLKLAIPMFEQACLEEDDELQDIWCKLISKSLDPEFDVAIKPAFIDILKSITSLDAKILKYTFDFVSENSAPNQEVDLNNCPVSLDEIKDKFSTVPYSDIMVSIYNLKRVQCIQEYLYKSRAVNDFSFSVGRDLYYVLTYLGSALVEACMK
ncbi:Abi-alpha family protein [Methanosarcina sp. UBA5]|uniref:Abi-alpha family protein n=1 Tax=Methanosarcina sp. UBA5 TaxID=1915593 RepID=UPI0025DE9246|nr:Abi-alpha family protein [Methanosarcina sp. UBA5]